MTVTNFAIAAIRAEENYAGDARGLASGEAAKWHVLWTRSNFEQKVQEQLLQKGYEAFLPTVCQWRMFRKSKRVRQSPMFKGYLFVRHEIDKHAYLDICQTKGLVTILGSSWDRLAEVPEQEIETIKRAVRSDLPVSPHPYLKEGDRIRIIKGPLAGTEGILVRRDENSGIFILSIHLLRRSVAIEVDCTQVVPV